MFCFCLCDFLSLSFFLSSNVEALKFTHQNEGGERERINPERESKRGEVGFIAAEERRFYYAGGEIKNTPSPLVYVSFTFFFFLFSFKLG